MLHHSSENPFETPVAGVPPEEPEQMVIVPNEEAWDGMTIAEWKKLDLPMEWAIFHEHETELPYEETPLDLTTGVEDGDYDAVYGYGDDAKNPFREQEYDGRTDGIVVENGEFVARPTVEAIYDLVRTFQRGRYGEIVRFGESMDHKFIEKMDWNPFGGYFRVDTGS